MAFAGEALTQVPVTLDYPVVEQAVMDLKIGSLEDGTAIGSGLATAVNRLRRAPDKSKVILLLTDGENNKGLIDPRTAAATASAFGIKVYTIGVGTIGEAPIPTGRGLGGFRYELLPVRIDEPLLREIAREDRWPVLPGPRQRGAEPHLPPDRRAGEDPGAGDSVHPVRRGHPSAHPARSRRARPGAAARQHAGGAGPMIFDVPILLFLAPAVALAVGFARLARPGPRIRLARRWSPALRGWRGPAAAGPPLLGLVALLAWWDSPVRAMGRTQITTQSRALSLVFAVDISRSMLAEDASPNRLHRACGRPGG